MSNAKLPKHLEKRYAYLLDSARTVEATPTKGKGRLPADRMNGLERRYADHLEGARRDGQVLWWAFEPMRLRIADNNFYRPDFGVMLADGTIEMHETKGFFREAAKVRTAVAASLYPFVFRLVRLVDDRWEITVLSVRQKEPTDKKA